MARHAEVQLDLVYRRQQVALLQNGIQRVPLQPPVRMIAACSSE